MKLYKIIVLLLIIGCNSQQESNLGKEKKTTSIVSDSLNKAGNNPGPDSVLILMTRKILTAVKNKDFKGFAEFMHPVSGVRFSPYGYIDTSKDVTLTANELVDNLKNNAIIRWGIFDGKGDTILLSVREYFEKFIYDVDFLNAEKTSANKMIGGGNSLNNLDSIYKDKNFTESYFSGFDKKYEGMDWRSLRLVFEKYNGAMYLVGIIHDQWTI